MRRKDAAIAGGLLGALSGLAVDSLFDGGRPFLHALAGGVAGAVVAGIGHRETLDTLAPARTVVAGKVARIAERKGLAIDQSHLEGLLRPMDADRLVLLARYLDAFAASDLPALQAILPQWESEMPDALNDPEWRYYKGIIF